jgi:hypothetical protein
MAYEALRTITPIAGWPEERARAVEISVPTFSGTRPLRDGCLFYLAPTLPRARAANEPQHLGRCRKINAACAARASATSGCGSRPDA